MRASSVINWRTFKEWVTQYQSPKLNGYFGEYWFKELEETVSCMRTGEIVHVDVLVERHTLASIAGPNKDRLRRLLSYPFLHENVWRVYILIHCDHPGRKEKENYSMRCYEGVFLKDKDGKLVYFRKFDKDKGMPLWNMAALAKQLSKES